MSEPMIWWNPGCPSTENRTRSPAAADGHRGRRRALQSKIGTDLQRKIQQEDQDVAAPLHQTTSSTLDTRMVVPFARSLLLMTSTMLSPPAV